MEQIRIGLAGLGTIGVGVYKNIEGNRELLAQRLGVGLAIVKVAERDWARERSVNVPEADRATDWRALVDDPTIPIVIELMGGIEQPRKFILAAIEAGKIVVTANKALLAEHGKEIFDAATRKKVPIFYEAAVAGGIPIIEAVREGLVANHILSIHGIVNGTSNYILTRMTGEGIGFAEALKAAQEAGYAEADPTLDVNGWDAAHKAIILASLAYGFWVPGDQISVEGIEKITAADIGFAENSGHRIKLLAIIKADAGGEVEVRVHPTLIPKSHVLASVSGVFNAIAVRGDVVGETLFYGRGAGQDPTASAVIADLAEAAICLESPRRFYGFTPHGLYGKCKPADEVVSEYYLRLQVEDEPGVLASVAGALATHGVGISSVIQPEGKQGEWIPLMLMIHRASTSRMKKALADIALLACVRGEPLLLRVENFAE
jgi:homoserine dehydrogenase